MNMTEKDEHIATQIIYFWKEKGDVERCSTWNNNLPYIKERFPEFYIAWQQYLASLRQLNRLVEEMSEEINS